MTRTPGRGSGHRGSSAERRPLIIDLALQGGGAHGAFAWGVLDRILEEDWPSIHAISGTDAARFSPFQRSPLDVLLGRWTLDNSPLFVAMDMMSRVVSPYSLNPGGTNPLSAILAEVIDFDALATAPVRLFVTATNVRTGRGRVFRNAEITPDVLLASACLPTLFHAVEIDGESYWDGGYSGNPTMTPLIRDSDALDTILVQINPVERARARRAPPATSSTASTRCRSTRCCSRNSG